jgi:predicted RNase H-like nuclease
MWVSLFLPDVTQVRDPIDGFNVPGGLGMPQFDPPTANSKCQDRSVAAMTVLGVDGWRGQWVAAEVTGRSIIWRVLADFRAVLQAYPHAAIGIDIPIGLPPRGARTCDQQARAFARGAASSVFPAPPRSMVTDWRPGQRYRAGLHLSAQAWNLIPAIHQVDTLMTPELQRDRVVEVHPECSFREMGGLIDAPKKTGRGVGQRIVALSRYFDLDRLDAAPPGPAIDDLLDAAAAAWTAQRWRDGRAIPMPAVSPALDEHRDERGLAMRIWV